MWAHQYLPELFTWLADVQNNVRQHEPELSFEWKKHWPQWQRNFRALLWLADRKVSPPEPLTRNDRIPRIIAEAVDGVLRETRNTIFTDYFSEARIRILLEGSFQVSRKFSTFEEFWQAVFVTFFQPDALAFGSICHECGRRLPQTKKLAKPSRATLCNKCAVQKWRKEHPERAQRQSRASKQESRKRNMESD
jgi:hypothetical protein